MLFVGGVRYVPWRRVIHWAADIGKKELVELLIAKDADVNAKDNNGGTVLHRAAESDNKEIVELLKKHGAKE